MYYIIIIFVILFAILFKIYNKLTCGWCHSKKVMTGKVVIITGANTGIGYETALDMAQRGANVILACRNEIKAMNAVKQIIQETGNTKVHFLHLDLNSLTSVRKFVKSFGEKEDKLDVLVNNAGLAGMQDEYSEDGIVAHMQTNHFAPFLLTILLVPYLKKAGNARIINVSSIAHWLGSINFDTINNINNSFFSVHLTYSCSKLCNVLFANELARRLKSDKIMVNSLHPGVINTEIFRYFAGIREFIIKTLIILFFKNAVEGAQTTIYLCVADIDYSGMYFSDCSLAWSSWRARNVDLAKRLWEYSESLVRLKDEEKI